MLIHIIAIVSEYSPAGISYLAVEEDRAFLYQDGEGNWSDHCHYILSHDVSESEVLQALAPRAEERATAMEEEARKELVKREAVAAELRAKFLLLDAPRIIDDNDIPVRSA